MITEMRLRSRVAEHVTHQLLGKCLGESDFDVCLTGACKLLTPDNRPLCIYLPGHVREHMSEEVYEVLHSLRDHKTANRGHASGSKRMRRGATDHRSRRSETVRIPSTVIGSLDAGGQQAHCRLTSWTGKNLPQWQILHPLLQAVGDALAMHVPERYIVQEKLASATNPAWIVPGTPFSSVTVNNTYPTGVHTDKGDLEAGYSTICTLRRGQYTGGKLVFPSYRVAVDLQDGDLILMDAHELHGNTVITCGCGKQTNGWCAKCGAERISVVAYYRQDMSKCGTPAEEEAKAYAGAETRSRAPKIPHPPPKR